MNLRDALQEVYDRHGELTPRLVVAAAKDPNNPLHTHFEWDIERAAEAHWLQRAHELIQKHTVVYRKPNSEEEVSIRKWHAVRTEQGHVYKAIEDVADDDFYREMVLRDAERAWRDLYKRYGHIQEFIALVRGDLAA